MMDLRRATSMKRNPNAARLVIAALCLLSAPVWLRAASGEAQFLSEVRQLIFEGKRSGEGYFSTDGRSLIFQSERDSDNPFYQIYLLDFETGDTHRVSPGIGKTTCAFFRPGTDEVLFASTHHDPETRSKMQAELGFRASGQQRRYSWDYDDQMEIWSARRDGSNLKRLTNAKGYDAEASYSPDGQLSDFGCMSWAPYFHPSGAYVVFTANKVGFDNFELFLVDAAGLREPARVTFTEGFDGLPVFSPDGQKLCWTSSRTSDKKSQL